MMKVLFKRLLFKYKHNKFRFYFTGFARLLVPAGFFRHNLHRKLEGLRDYDFAYIKSRVNYYNKLTAVKTLGPHVKSLSKFKLGRKFRTYFFDSYEYTRYYNPELRISFLFGDITHVPEDVSIVKSRPVRGDNENSILLKLNKVRHFMFVNDKKDFRSKENKLVGRNVVSVPHRVRFYEKYFDHSMCDLGKINRTGVNDHWIKKRLTFEEHLENKFVLCLEGNDVATNLKWVMSSNSLPVMPVPKFETWFMEGKLIADTHFVAIQDDYADLEEKLKYYIKNTDQALRILANAHQHVNQFRNKKQEDLISLLVLEKYFYRTGQLAPRDTSVYI
jgi:hypothetical protein